jgi:hypothetical protein
MGSLYFDAYNFIFVFGNIAMTWANNGIGIQARRLTERKALKMLLLGCDASRQYIGKSCLCSCIDYLEFWYLLLLP